MPWILDGNNLARGRDRRRVRLAALAVARNERVRIVVVFDGVPPPGAPEQERLGQVEVRYTPNADAAIVAFLQRAGRGWRLATDDVQLGAAAKRAGAEVVPASRFWRKAAGQAARVDGGSPGDVGQELAFLADRANRLPAGPRRVPRRRRGRR